MSKLPIVNFFLVSQDITEVVIKSKIQAKCVFNFQMNQAATEL